DVCSSDLGHEAVLVLLSKNQLALRLALRTTRSHRSTSSLPKAAKLCAELGGVGAMYALFLKAVTTSGDCSDLFKASLSLAITAWGVPLGADRPNQDCTTKSLSLFSVKVGTSGSESTRWSMVVARARSLPACTCGSDEGRLSNMESTWPPSRSATAGPLPR